MGGRGSFSGLADSVKNSEEDTPTVKEIEDLSQFKRYQMDKEEIWWF